VHTDQKPVGRSDQIKEYVQGYKPKKGLAMCKHTRPWGHEVSLQQQQQQQQRQQQQQKDG
jgi:hypothetical protein